MMNGHDLWPWFVVGMIPYTLKRQFLTNGSRLLQAHAFFWSAEIRLSRRGQVQWTIRIPLIQRLGNALWETLMRLREDKPDKSQQE
jgi:hypothetical protein